MGNCLNNKNGKLPKTSKEMKSMLKRDTEDLAMQKPKVVDVVLPSAILKYKDSEMKDGGRKAEEANIGQKIFESGVMRWNLQEMKIPKQMEEDPSLNTKNKSVDQEAARYIKRLQLSMPSLFGDDKARSISVGTAFKLGQTVLTLNDQESNTYLKVGLPEGNTLDMAKADVSSRQSLS